MATRIEEARRAVLSLLDDLEGSSLAIEAILMKAKRLARLMRDADAQLWLDLETRGYPNDFDFSTLGTCRQYAASGARIDLDAMNYYPMSLPYLEAKLTSEEAILGSLCSPSSLTTPVKDFLEAGATERVLATQLATQNKQKYNHAKFKGVFVSMKAAIHNYVTDTYLAIELGDIAEEIFESARNEVDAFVRAHCPRAAEKLIAINDRMADKSSEARTAALTSCRRLLMTVADSLFPARNEEWEDGNGKRRKVGVEQYKNRLLAYLGEALKNGGSGGIIESELEHLAALLDAIYEKTCKGVHVDVSEEEARLAVIHTYLFIGKIAACANKAEK